MSRGWQYVWLVLLGIVCAGLTTYALVRDPTPAPPQTASDRPGASVSPTQSPDCVPPDRLAVLGDSTRREAVGDGAFFDTLRTQLPDTGVRSFARDRNTLDAYVTDPVQGDVDKWGPDAIELSIGIGDLSRDQSPGRVKQLTAGLGAYVDGLQVRFPDIPIVLSVPAALNTNDVDGSGYIAPPGAAVEATRGLRTAYLAVAEQRPWLTLVDVQQAITGTDADSARPPRFLADQIHPNATTAAQIAQLVVDRIGCPA